MATGQVRRREARSGIGRAAGALYILVLAALVAGCGVSAGAGADGTASAARPTAPPSTVTPAPSGSYAVDVQTAWGPGAAIALLKSPMDARHVFVASGITPDGHALLGFEYVPDARGIAASPVPAQAGLLDITSERFTAIGVSATPNYAPGCCQSDGRFLVASDSTAPGATCGVCHLRLWSYDTTTRQLWQVAVGSQYGDILGAFLSHGLMLLVTGAGDRLYVANLAARTIAPLTLPGIPAQTQVFVATFSWPYLVYNFNQASGTPATRAFDFVTRHEIALAGVTSLAASSGVQLTGSLTGDTLFFALAPANGSLTRLYQLDHLMASGASPRLLATYAAGGEGVQTANDRLVALRSVVWDRAQGRFVDFGASMRVLGLAGSFLVVGDQRGAQGDNASPQFVIYDTSRLPAH
jgi:hypothetical protein